MLSTHRGDGPGEAPAVGMKHGQHPQIAICARDPRVHQVAHDVQCRIAVRDHHSLWIGGRAARVVERDHVSLADDWRREVWRRAGKCSLVVPPALPGAFQGHKVLHARPLGANGVHVGKVVRVGAHNARAAMFQDVGKVSRREPEVDRHRDCADLRHGIVGLQMRMGVRRDHGHPVSPADAEPLKR